VPRHTGKLRKTNNCPKVSAPQSIAMLLGSPRFMLHDLRKLVARVGVKLGLGDAVLRRILNHTAPKTDVLHRHFVGLNEGDVVGALALFWWGDEYE